jgi:hypothetical protein
MRKQEMIFAGNVLIWGTDYVGTHTDKECGQDGNHEDFWELETQVKSSK